mmetsp:Transcript_29704/g.85451  ORF Transcript_29704/g.85451 Transcript_29704/m.85451 type:complete len:209 (+) Transcript_29704:593-1219(+)
MDDHRRTRPRWLQHRRRAGAQQRLWPDGCLRARGHPLSRGLASAGLCVVCARRGCSADGRVPVGLQEVTWRHACEESLVVDQPAAVVRALPGSKVLRTSPLIPMRKHRNQLWARRHHSICRRQWPGGSRKHRGHHRAHAQQGWQRVLARACRAHLRRWRQLQEVYNLPYVHVTVAVPIVPSRRRVHAASARKLAILVLIAGVTCFTSP